LRKQEKRKAEKGRGGCERQTFLKGKGNGKLDFEGFQAVPGDTKN
jgi:hypothetical protein